MTKREAKERIEKLRKEIDHHRYLYHVVGEDTISDSARDSLMHELVKLEEQFPDLLTPDSPSVRVAGKVLEKFEKVEHPRSMLSLNDAFTKEELEAWEERIVKFARKEFNFQGTLDYYAEIKMDGLAVSLEYEQGKLTRASTRGDGKTGENVTENLKTIQSIPLVINEEFIAKNILPRKDCGGLKGFMNRGKRITPQTPSQPLRGEMNVNTSEQFIELGKKCIRGNFEVRGEVFMTKKAFEAMNASLPENAQFANPRNAAAGSIRQLDSSIARSRQLSFSAYDFFSDTVDVPTHECAHVLSRLLGFPVNGFNRYCASLSEAIVFHEVIGKKRGSLPYETDGIVVNVNDTLVFQRLGVVGKTPRGSIAFKWPGIQSTTHVEDIIVQIGRQGTLTPVARLAPTNVGGVTVTRATLHNRDEIERLGVRIGDTVILERAGDVIPHVVRVLPNLRTGKEKKFSMPKTCPFCKSEVVRNENEIAYYCSNKNCFAVEREKFYHFVSRKAFNIEKLGPKIIDRFLEEKLIIAIPDIFDLKKENIEELFRFGEKSAQNLIDSIRKSKNIPLARFLYALGIRHVGEETALAVATAISQKHAPHRTEGSGAGSKVSAKGGSDAGGASVLRHDASGGKSQKFGKEVLEIFTNMSLAQWMEIEDIGEIVAQSMYDYFHDKKNIRMIEKLFENGVMIENYQLPITNGQLKNKTFVITGTLPTLSREQARELIRAHGGDVNESVSKYTDYVLVGENPGSKYEKAKKLGVKIISEKELQKMAA